MRTDRLSLPLVWRCCLALAAGALLVRESLVSSPSVLAASEEPAALERSSSNIAAQRPPSASYPAVATHPLFDPSRQPWTPPARKPLAQVPVASIPAPVPPRGYTLVGLVTGQHQRSALLRDPFGKTVFLAEEQLLLGWTVKRIDAKGVHFQADGSHYDLAIPLARDMAIRR